MTPSENSFSAAFQYQAWLVNIVLRIGKSQFEELRRHGAGYSIFGTALAPGGFAVFA
jgi:hypothetical protein